MARPRPPKPIDLGAIATLSYDYDDGPPAVAAPVDLHERWTEWVAQSTERAPELPAYPPDGRNLVLVGLDESFCDDPEHDWRSDNPDGYSTECPSCVAEAVRRGWTARVRLDASLRYPDCVPSEGEPDDWREYVPDLEPVELACVEVPDAAARAMLAARIENVLDPLRPGGDAGVALRDGGPWAALLVIVEALEEGARRRRGAA